MHRTVALRIITLFALVALATVPAIAQDGAADVGSAGTPPSNLGTVSQIPSMTVPNVAFDFDAMPAGNTTVADIQAAFPGSVLADLTFTPRDLTGGYNFQISGGRALAASDLAGTLALVDPPAGAFASSDDLTIDLSAPSTEMGFEVGDWNGPFNAEVYDGATLIDTLTVTTTEPNILFFLQSTTPFDRIVLTANPQNPAANWVIPSLHLEQGGEADLVLTKSADPDPVAPGGTLTYTLTVTNNGPDDASNVVVDDVLPVEFSYTGDDCGGAVAGGPPGGTFTWMVGTLANGANAVCNVTGTVDAAVPNGTTIANNATATSDTNDPTPGNETAAATTTVSQSILEIPTLSQVGLAILLVLLAGIAVWRIRRAQHA